MSRLTDANRAQRDQILACLRDRWPLSTQEVTDAVTSRGYDPNVYRNLMALERLGQVDRLVRQPESRSVYWRYLPAAPAVPDEDLPDLDAITGQPGDATP